ncbi:MAG: 3-hydroxyacyl-CoA dehydrogenase NAD-binding domain-containing protein [Flavobacteriales bacterium]
MKIGVIGSGAMGSGIAQVAAQAGYEVVVYDQQKAALERAENGLKSTLSKLVDKGKISAEDSLSILGRIAFRESLEALISSDLVIEAIVENIDIKKSVFQAVEALVSDTCILATNTSSLSVTAIAASCAKPGRFIGIHFFNPAPLMPLVEIIPALQTDEALAEKCVNLMRSWGKVPVVCKDTPGFIVNRVARPYYSEALRIVDEGIADMPTVDQAMRDQGFRMGPFELMDMIGHDVNYTVTESVFTAMYFDPRFRPSITQKKLVEAQWLGRKSGRGFYNYAEGSTQPAPSDNMNLRKEISDRILAMLINEAFDSVYLGVASAEDIDLAMTKGVNYPKGLIAWGKELGLSAVREQLVLLQEKYGEDRYRVSAGMGTED